MFFRVFTFALLLASGCGDPCRRDGTSDFYGRRGRNEVPVGGSAFPTEWTGTLSLGPGQNAIFASNIGSTGACTTQYQSFANDRCSLRVDCPCATAECTGLWATAIYSSQDEVVSGRSEVFEPTTHVVASYLWSVTPTGER